MSNMNDESRGALALANASPRAVGRAGIIGATPVGVGLAMKLLEADIPVTLFDSGREALERGLALARSAYADAVARGVLAQHQQDRRMALLAGTVNFHHLKDADLIIDAAGADPEGKERLFRRLDQVARTDAILVTDAAHGGVDRIAALTRRAGEVVGLHFQDPGHAGATWEAVCGKDTSAQALATVIALASMFHEAAPVPD